MESNMTHKNLVQYERLMEIEVKAGNRVPDVESSKRRGKTAVN
jgi:hypothetical protein